MISIKRATPGDFAIIAELGGKTFLESHGNSGPKTDIDNYTQEKYSYDTIKQELNNPDNIYHLLLSDGEPAGYSKIILNCPHPAISSQSITKLERIYILKKYYDKKLGQALLEFNLNLSKSNNQSGMWLYVWKENHRAIKFYIKNGFQTIGAYDFKISETHSNPNHHLYLQYQDY